VVASGGLNLSSSMKADLLTLTKSGRSDVVANRNVRMFYMVTCFICGS
jgi:hypothetical protein